MGGGDGVEELFGISTGTLCDCVVFGEPLTAPMFSSSSRLGKVRQTLSLLSPPPPSNLLIKSTLRRAKQDNRGKVGRLHSLSQEEEVPSPVPGASLALPLQPVAQLETRQRAH